MKLAIHIQTQPEFRRGSIFVAIGPYFARLDRCPFRNGARSPILPVADSPTQKSLPFRKPTPRYGPPGRDRTGLDIGGNWFRDANANVRKHMPQVASRSLGNTARPFTPATTVSSRKNVPRFVLRSFFVLSAAERLGMRRPSIKSGRIN